MSETLVSKQQTENNQQIAKSSVELFHKSFTSFKIEAIPDTELMDDIQFNLDELLAEELEEKAYKKSFLNANKATVTVPRWASPDEHSVNITWSIGKDEEDRLRPMAVPVDPDGKLRVMAVLSAKNIDDVRGNDQTYLLMSVSPHGATSTDEITDERVLFKVSKTEPPQQATEDEIKGLSDSIVHLQYPDKEQKAA
jgi:hypothetical protein